MLIRNRSIALTAVPLALLGIITLSQQSNAATGDLLLPNLKALPATNIAFGSVNDLRFSTTSWNAGAGPLILKAGTTSSPTSQNVDQEIALEGGGTVLRNAGDFVWHPTHSHFHFEGYARYTIQPAGASGGSERIGQKTTFCVMDTTRVNTTLPGAPAIAGYSTCGSQTQGMSVGWGDTYGSSLSGQSVDMTGMPDGDYRLYIDIDPYHRLSESTREDNQSCVLLRLSVTRRTVTVLNPNDCTATTVSAVAPAVSSGLNATVQITVTGTGFVTGMKPTFTNGIGSTFTVSSVVVVNPQTLTAKVVVKTKSASRATDRVWDVTVGGATLANAFTVNTG
ncbi:MAG: hypothetical protein RL119_1168 [Actinomycetota bacterium]